MGIVAMIQMPHKMVYRDVHLGIYCDLDMFSIRIYNDSLIL